MTKFFVKKPYFMIVAIIMVLIIGSVSLSSMQTDLLPDLELPYIAVITTEIGASPEKVEKDVTEVLESSLGTLSGVEEVTSNSSNNYGIVMLSFADNTDMDSALVRVSKTLNSLDLPDECGTPNILEISMDVLATIYADVNHKDMDIKELSEFTEKTIKPYLEKQEGVASVSANGLIKDSVEIRLNSKKIDRINGKILAKTNSKLAEADDEISTSKSKLRESKKKLEESEKELSKQQKKTNKKLGDASAQLTKAQATKAAYDSGLASLKAAKAALEAEKKAYEDAKIKDTYSTLNSTLASLNQSLSPVSQAAGVTVPSSVKEAVQNPDDFKSFISFMNQNGYGDQVAALKIDDLKKVYNVVEVRIPQIDTEVANLEVEIKAQEAVISTLGKKLKNLDSAQSQSTSAGLTAAATFGAGQAKINSAKTEITNAEKELKNAEEKLDDSIKAAKENSNLNALLTLDTLSQLISAQNFSMPAGYIEDKESNQWLVEVNEKFENPKQLKNLVLTKLDGVGKIRLKDVADISVIDNIGEAYSKVNGEDAVMISVYKASTANTSTVSDRIQNAFDELESKYDGLSFTNMMNQGSYITRIINTVLSSILIGAILAILVLALFLKSVKPTIVVAFSIPFSVMFALIIMYFSGININVMSLAGLCISIGMLVDNSVVVMENIFRLRQKGVPAPRAAVQGTKQVAAPIIASTATTICVFLPMVYTTGMIAQLLIPFAFTISYALVASLLVALTVVPTLGFMLLKNTKERKENWFDKLKNAYAKALSLCLNHKAISIIVSVALLAICIFQTFNTGIVMIDNAESNQISVSMTLEDDTTKKDAYKTADEVMDILMNIKGISKISALDGNTGIMSSIIGSGVSDNYTTFSFSVLTDDDVKTTNEYKRIRQEIEEKTKNIKCKEISTASSAMGSKSSLSDTGLTVNIYGDDKDKLIKISEDVMKMMKEIKGVETVQNGITEADKTLKLHINRNKAAEYGLTVAQIFQQIATKATTEKNALTMRLGDKDVDVTIVDKTNKLTYENILKLKIETTTKNANGEDVKKKYKLEKFATAEDGYTMDSIRRVNQRTYLSVTAEIGEQYNSALLSRDMQKKLDSYKAPSGYEVEIAGSSIQITDMLNQMLQAILLGFLLIYLIMVAQFQSFLSPFIVIFTVPLAFTGGMIGLGLFGMTISSMSLMGFMILMGTVVNNGIVFVDYANKLRLHGVDKRKALIETGKTRMRPILMTALTTILSMSVMVFSQDAGNAMQRSMAVVVSVGLLYSTIMTLFIVPVMYDILYRKQPKEIDVGDKLDDEMDETEEEAKNIFNNTAE
ncbi:MAG: efflux RND transporter permease subunit [Ruminococcus sp.]|nr:efflux RND transporter permease subunit [Ruminococcus sp.]